MMITSLRETKSQNITLVTEYHNKVFKNNIREIIKNTKCFFTYLTLHSSSQAFFTSQMSWVLFSFQNQPLHQARKQEQIRQS